MNIEKKTNYTLISPTEPSLSEFIAELELSIYKKENILLNFLDSFQLTAIELDVFSDISLHKKANGTSFIIILQGIDIDDLNDESLAVVPTLIEAEDTLEMDAIERDLGL